MFLLIMCICVCRANPVWLDPFCRNLELAAQADHEDDLPENLSEITDLWNSPARTHVSTRIKLLLQATSIVTFPVFFISIFSSQGTFGREPQAKPEDDSYLRAAIQEYDNIAKLGQIMREGPIKVRLIYLLSSFGNTLGDNGRKLTSPPVSFGEKIENVQIIRFLPSALYYDHGWSEFCGDDRLCLNLTAVLSGLPAEGGPGWLPEAEKALCSSARHCVHQSGRSLVSYGGGLRKGDDLFASASPVWQRWRVNLHSLIPSLDVLSAALVWDQSVGLSLFSTLFSWCFSQIFPASNFWIFSFLVLAYVFRFPFPEFSPTKTFRLFNCCFNTQLYLFSFWQFFSFFFSIILKLIQSDLDEDEDERLGMGGGRGTLRFKHKLPVELKGPEGVHVVHGSTGTLLTSDLSSLPEDDQRALARSLEALNADRGLYSERNARTESAKSTPMHRHKDGDTISQSPLEITELWLAEASLVWAQWWLVCVLVPPHDHPGERGRWEGCM